MAALTLILLFAAAPAMGRPNEVHVVYIYSPSCSACERSGPVIRSAVDDSRGAGLSVRYDELPFSSKEGMGYMERFGLGSVPAVIIGDRAIRFEDYNGDLNELKNLLRDGIEKASRYRSPVMLERKVVKAPEKNTIKVVTYVSNTGDEPVYATVDGLEGVRVVSGNASWQGLVMPGERQHYAYEADVDGKVKSLPAQALTYADSSGNHSIVGQETPLFLSRGLSMSAAFLAGVIAGVNPCLLAVMAFVSAMALSMRSRRLDIILNLVMFCTGLLSVYLLMGIGFLQLIEHMPSFAAILKAGIVLLLIALAGFAFYEAYQLKRNPGRRSLFKQFLERYRPAYMRFRLAANFGLGGAFGLIKMPCVGGIYVAILGAIVESGEAGGGFPYLAAYNFGVVLPVLALGILLAFGLSPGKVDEFRERHRLILKVATGIILIIMAGSFVFNIF